MLKEVFSFEGFHVLQARNGREAFALIQSNDAIDLVLSDIQMTGGDGIELMKNLHAYDQPRKPGLMLTTGSASALGFDPAAYDVVAVHEKPVDYERLIQIIQDYGQRRNLSLNININRSAESKADRENDKNPASF